MLDGPVRHSSSFAPGAHSNAESRLRLTAREDGDEQNQTESPGCA